VSKKSNVHPDHYKTDGRDRPDDAAAARLNRAIVAKMASRESLDPAAKKFYFERPEATEPVPAKDTGSRGAKKKAARPRAAKSRAGKKVAVPRRALTTRKAGPRRKGAGKK
jgi:hypothetical protein